MALNDIYTVHDIERFWCFVYIGKPDECWEWLGGGAIHNYGAFNLCNRRIDAHRFSYWIHTGIYPGELFVLHKCDNKHCVNPKHLFLGTQKDNMQDCVKKGRLNTVCGSKHCMSRLTEDDVHKIRSSYANGTKTRRQLAKEYNVHWTTINSAVKYKSYKYI